MKSIGKNRRIIVINKYYFLLWYSENLSQNCNIKYVFIWLYLIRLPPTLLKTICNWKSVSYSYLVVNY